MATGQLIGHLRTRLRTEDLLRRHPEIRRRADRAADRRRRPAALRHHAPAQPAVGRHGTALVAVLGKPRAASPHRTTRRATAGDAARVERTRVALDFTNGVMPHFKAMHEMTAEHSHEEVQLMTPIFSTCLFESQWRIPEYAEWYAASDQRPAYAYLRQMLQILQWQRGGTRWVLKSPSHLEQFGPLMAEFPDATVVLTHRDPVTVTASFATMVSYAARTSVEHPDPLAIGQHWAARTQQFLMAAVRDRELLPADQSMDVLFPRLHGRRDVGGRADLCAGRAADARRQSGSVAGLSRQSSAGSARHRALRPGDGRPGSRGAAGCAAAVLRTLRRP